ncbi:TetR family transcriptional regulator [Microbispora triticiradicis]|uniref:TetR family transcriptional regulator n=3 Tax=Microbispora TaxID=2005 RepID=A0ABY3M4C8_9ACTN|nr:MULTISPECIES: TetR family transcriptional regulator [Microbispora]RGA01626.1 TetR family transcriptional regulator [Microbispora triticiradicis]TLP56920.1 TetR family transcriptional regulator [Microbispora fusca]TYB66875.1 TetR family transcriptional regulator [Microbispora tritici]
MSSPQRADRNSAASTSAVTSLRERKKAKTRRTIQEEALRLFAEQGYEATTVEQIAEAAEVSPSTFFRYFPTKEDVVIQDDYDPMLLEAIRAQPPDLPPLTALRAAFRTAFESIGPEELDQMLARIKLTTSVPALRARTVEGLFATIELLAAAMAERSGRDPRGPAVRTLAGAVLGVILTALFGWVEQDGRTPLLVLIDEALGYLEAGLPI